MLVESDPTNTRSINLSEGAQSPSTAQLHHVPRQLTPEEERHRRNNLRLWIVSCLAFITICPIISVMIGLDLHARNLFYQPSPGVVPFAGRQVLMEVVLITADPMAQTMTLDWTFIGEETSPCSAANLTGCMEINIFFDRYVDIFRHPFFPLMLNLPGKQSSL